MAKGYLIPVLHCHLPYVHHPDYDDFLEEDWFYEAVSETYVPLLHVLERLEADGVPFALTLSFSPTLCEMLSNDLLQRRCVRYLERRVELAEKEIGRTEGGPFSEAARLYHRRYREVHRTYAERYDRKLLRGFAELAQRGSIELIGSAATHALLPLLDTSEGKRAQVAVGLRNFEKHFGGRPGGFWLPECAYGPGIDDILAEFGLQYFFVDTHGVLLAEPRPRFGVFAPLATPAGVLAFGRDVESSRQVWSADEGYPGAPEYREFYRDLGYDAELEYLRPYLHADGVHRYLGFKYHRITGDVPLDRKEPYRPGDATARAEAHAEHFVKHRVDQVSRLHRATGLDPVIVAPYDAELFGHWWLEGLQFLESVFRRAAVRDELACVTPGHYLRDRRDRRPGAAQAGRPALSTWGDRGYFEVWVNGSNDWIYPRLHAAEAGMVQAAVSMPAAEGLTGRALDQCARELMLAQSSDWPFLMSVGTARDYAVRRFKDLMGRFDDLFGQVRAGKIDKGRLETYEWLDDAFPEMDYTVFRKNQHGPHSSAG